MNIQHGINNAIFLELPNTLADLLQAVGRIHRLGSRLPQDIKVLTLDGSFEMIQQYRLWNKYVPYLVTRSPPIPADVREQGNEACQKYLHDWADLRLQILLGTRGSRLICGNPETPLFSFEKFPPGKPLPEGVKKRLTGMFPSPPLGWPS